MISLVFGFESSKLLYPALQFEEKVGDPGDKHVTRDFERGAWFPTFTKH